MAPQSFLYSMDMSNTVRRIANQQTPLPSLSPATRILMSCSLPSRFVLLSLMLKRDRMKERGAIFGCMLEHGAHSWAAGRFRDEKFEVKTSEC